MDCPFSIARPLQRSDLPPYGQKHRLNGPKRIGERLAPFGQRRSKIKVSLI